MMAFFDIRVRNIDGARREYPTIFSINGDIFSSSTMLFPSSAPTVVVLSLLHSD